MQQPVGSSVEQETELVCLPAVAGGVVGFGVEFVLYRIICTAYREATMELEIVYGGHPHQVQSLQHGR